MLDNPRPAAGSPRPPTPHERPSSETTTGGARRPSPAGGLLRSARPKQWTKNLLVFAAPGAARVIAHGPVLAHSVVAFAAFCLVSSGTYLLNDVHDVESDRRHPLKRHRPVAAGQVPPRVALVAGLLGIAAGFAVGSMLGWRMAVTLAVYLTVSASYTLWLKRVAVLDIAAVASGFVVRAVAGGVAAEVPISKWFLIVASFGSLFMVAGKRHAEHVELGADRASVRSTLGDYSLAFLRYVWMLSSGVAITGYCLWAFEQSAGRTGFPWYELSIIPFVLAVLRYALLLETGHGGAPEEVVLGDRGIQVLGLVWVLVFAGGVYIGR